MDLIKSYLMETSEENPESFVVCALYKFVRISDPTELQPRLLDLLKSNNVCGTILLAEEGINGTIAGTRENINAVIQWLQAYPRFQALEIKESFTSTLPFLNTKVKIKREIVTMGVPTVDPTNSVGTYVKPRDWNRIISDPDVTVIDTRNDYEVKIGTFSRALNPSTESFREFPAYADQNLDPEKHRKVAMFCTGGIRCEKATSYLRQKGFSEVYHLEGGILRYLEEVPPKESLWEGECFVFDRRVSVKHGLEEGTYDICHACRLPISAEDKANDKFEDGVSCPRCFDERTPDQKRRYLEREEQVRRAARQGAVHLGAKAQEYAQKRHTEKKQSKKRQRGQVWPSRD